MDNPRKEKLKILKIIKILVIKLRTNCIYFLIIKSKSFRRFYFNRILNKFNPDLKNIDKNKKTLVIVWEERFNYLKSILLNDKKINLILLPRIFFSPGFKFFLNKYSKSQPNISLGEYNLDYYRSDKFKDNRLKFRNYCQSVNNFVRRYGNIDLILMPKCNDDWTIDYIKVINNEDIKLIIDDREGAITPQRLKTVPEKLRNLDLSFNLMTTHNSYHKSLFVKAGFPSSKIKINGATQSDYWLNPSHWKTLKEIDLKLSENLLKILFFSFGKRTYMNFYYGEEKRTWMPLIKDVNDVLIEILNKFEGEIQIIYKISGKLKRDTSEDINRLRKEAKKHIDKNYLLFLDGSKSSFDLIRHSQAIIGFQTSGIIEAMNTNKPIFYSGWGDLYNDIGESLLPIENSNCVTVSNSNTELYSNLCELINNYDDIGNQTMKRESRTQLVKKFFSQSNGKVSERLANLIYENM